MRKNTIIARSELSPTFSNENVCGYATTCEHEIYEEGSPTIKADKTKYVCDNMANGTRLIYLKDGRQDGSCRSCQFTVMKRCEEDKVPLPMDANMVEHDADQSTSTNIPKNEDQGSKGKRISDNPDESTEAWVNASSGLRFHCKVQTSRPPSTMLIVKICIHCKVQTFRLP